MGVRKAKTLKGEMKMDEYISKQKVIDYLNGYLHSLGEGGTDDLLFDRGQRRALINSIQDISAEKAADVQPVKHGRWIPQGNDMWLCSSCKENIIYSMHKSDRQKKQRYCSRCGARMDIVYQDDKVTAIEVKEW